MRRLTHSRFVLAGMAIIATMALTGGIAWAVINPVSGGVIHACYNPATGAMQLKVTGACPTSGNKTPLNWNVTGAKGSTGATGPAGHDPIEDVTWAAALPAKASGAVFSHTGFGQNAKLDGLSGKLTGNFSACTAGWSVAVGLHASNGQSLVIWEHSGAGSNVVNMAPTILKSITNGVAANEPLEMYGVGCVNLKNVSLPAPAVTYSVTIRWTHPTPTRAIT